jgi:hypothetical protein
MGEAIAWLIKLPFVLVIAIVALALGLVGGIVSLVAVLLTPVLGVGLLILPVGLVLLWVAGLLGRLLRPRPRYLVYR